MQIVSDIRLYIDEVLDAPDSQDMMISRAREFNPALSDQDVAPLIDQLEAFVRGTPDLVEMAAVEAEQLDVLDGLEPLLNKALEYFLDDDDVIPDHFGLYGLLDDAYLTQKYLVHASARHEEQFGVPLFGGQLQPAVTVIGQWIGDDGVNVLDDIVDTEFQTFNLKGALVVGALGLLAVGAIGSLFTDSGGGGSWGNSWESNMAQQAAGMGLSLNF